VVILSQPRFSRPMHFEEAVKQGKQIFMENTRAGTDAGLESKSAQAAEEAKAKKHKCGRGITATFRITIVDDSNEFMMELIGEYHRRTSVWNDGGVWVRERLTGPDEMEYEMRNWYYFQLLCGDHITEQHVHNI